MPELYPNYFFIGSLLTFLFLVYVAILLYRIPGRSAASTQLAVAMVFTGIFNLSYVITHGIYTLPNFYTRWLNFYTAMAAGLHVAAFFRSFPRVRSVRTVRYTLIIGHASILLVTSYLAYEMANAPVYYLFNSHFWDSDTLPAQKAVSVAILLHFIHFVGTGIWRGFIEKGEQRTGVWLIAAAFLVATIPPAILQVLSRDNLIPRSVFMTSTVIFNLVGYFIAIVVYINITHDRTSVLGRITGITLLAVLLIFQAVAYFWMNDAEAGYDAVHYGQAREGYVLGQLPQRAALQVVYDHGGARLLNEPGDAYTPAQNLLQQLQATFLMAELSALPGGDGLKNAAVTLVEQAARYSPIQSAYLRQLVLSRDFASGADIARAIVALRSQQLYQLAKLRQMPPTEFAARRAALIQALDGRFPGFAPAATVYQGAEPEALRGLLAAALTPWRQEGERLYRGEIYYRGKFPAHFVAFPFVDMAKRRVIEVAYPYIEYREAIAHRAWPLVNIIVFAFFFIFIGFSLFFRGALMKPINALVHGLKEIHNNNFDARVRVQVEDEIGFMAKSFNKMARSIKAGRMRLQRYAEQLEEKVKERTAELQNTLKDVQALKAQQDGDYFLTTLLLKPLGVNEVDSRFVGVESFVRQKKKFEFRHWSKDIGGDINISHVIELEGKRYVAFINGDAMGKSIQGAGGALVLGSVFHTIIERTQATEAMRQLAPERWLKNAFIELHRVFESFDGSMLVSGFFGLIDEKTGLMYHILAEHPRAVLLRNGKASFVENDRMLRKLGTTGVEGTLVIATTQLEPGDVMIVGSDGRDDIILGHDEHGGRIINEDENLFLSIVEEAAGDLQAIVRALEAQGEIMDDLSLMRVERYREEHSIHRAFDYSGVLQGVKRDIRQGATTKAIQRIEAYLQHDAFYPEAVKNLAQIYYQAKNYEKAANYAQDYLWLKPSDAEFVYFAALCFRRIRDFRRAIDLSERLRLRETPMAKNLALLTDLHLRTGNITRAETMLAELIEHDAEFSSIQILKRKFADATRSS
ncbi:MAG: SpoIIE family protein phosphatase [Spirochaetota bacterium]